MGLGTEIFFNEDQVSKIFPFYMEIDSDMIITSIGPSLEKIFTSNIINKTFTEFFSVERPYFKEFSWDGFVESAHKLFILKIDGSDFLLRGQFAYIQSKNVLFFIGTPWVNNIEAMKSKNLLLTDFPVHDQTFDLLHILKNVEINSDEIKQLLNKLKEKSEKIKQSEARYKTTLNLASEIIYRTDKNGKFIYVNPAGEKLSGYTNTELLEKNFTDLVRHDYTFKVKRQYFNQILNSIESTYSEFPIVTKTGDIKWIGQSVQLTSGDNDFEFVALAIDITAKKNSEIELIDNNKKLELLNTLIDNTSDAIQVSLESGQLVYMNDEASKRLGIYKKKASNYYVKDFELIFENDLAWKNHVNEVKNKKTIIIEGTNLNKLTGKVFPVEVTVTYTIIEGIGYIIANSRDISERKLIEENVRKQKEKYQNIIDNMNLGLLEVDLEERIQYVNPGFCKISGFDASEIIGKKATEVFVPESQKDLIHSKTKKRIEGIADMYEILVKNKNGVNRWWMISGAPNYNEKGEMVGSIGIHLDVTAAKQLELELELAKQKAEESSKAKEAFLANMSHEIRTPLNAIIGMIRELKKDKLSMKQGYYADNASIASQHLLSVLNNILDISKIEAGELQLENNDFDFRTIITDVKSIMMARCLEKDLFFQINHPADVLSCFIGDAARIRQILLNLAGNAVKFTEKGGILINYNITQYNQTTSQLEISIADTGIGMDATFLKNLFNKFSQEDASISRKYGGSGLGMAITKELIQLMNGTIEVESEKNIGTRFVLKFILPKGNPNHVIKHNEDIAFKQNFKVLLVEDNEFNRIVATNTLKLFNCDITEAQNGKEALSILNKNQNFDIILMDLQMPIMDGFETTKFIRNRLKLQIPIVALTANAFKSELEQCKNIGMNDFVTKPFEEKGLMKVIYKVLNSNADAELKTDTPIIIPSDEKLVNLDYLKSIFKDDTAQINKMISIFIEQIQTAIKEIDAEYKVLNLDRVAQIVHKIKPSIDNMGIVVLKDVTRFIEKAAKQNNNSPELSSNINTLLNTLKKVIEELK